MDGDSLVHKMAATQNFGKKKNNMIKKKPAAAAKKAMKKPPAKAEGHEETCDGSEGGHVVKMRYVTANRHPSGTCCQMLLEGKWKHIVTVETRQHAKHADIVKHIGALVQSGKLSVDEAKASKWDIMANWP